MNLSSTLALSYHYYVLTYSIVSIHLPCLILSWFFFLILFLTFWSFLFHIFPFFAIFAFFSFLSSFRPPFLSFLPSFPSLLLSLHYIFSFLSILSSSKLLHLNNFAGRCPQRRKHGVRSEFRMHNIRGR